jgi:hypothetical protein
MPSTIPKTTPTRDLKMPKSSPTLVVRLDQSGDEAITPPANNKDITSPADNKALFSLNSLPIHKGSISRRVLVLY